MAKPHFYYCRYCGKKFRQFYMAEICFELDMKELEMEEKKNRGNEKEKETSKTVEEVGDN